MSQVWFMTLNQGQILQGQCHRAHVAKINVRAETFHLYYKLDFNDASHDYSQLINGVSWPWLKVIFLKSESQCMYGQNFWVLRFYYFCTPDQFDDYWMV